MKCRSGQNSLLSRMNCTIVARCSTLDGSLLSESVTLITMQHTSVHFNGRTAQC